MWAEQICKKLSFGFMRIGLASMHTLPTAIKLRLLLADNSACEQLTKVAGTLNVR